MSTTGIFIDSEIDQPFSLDTPLSLVSRDLCTVQVFILFNLLLSDALFKYDCCHLINVTREEENALPGGVVGCCIVGCLHLATVGVSI